MFYFKKNQFFLEFILTLFYELTFSNFVFNINLALKGKYFIYFNHGLTMSYLDFVFNCPKVETLYKHNYLRLKGMSYNLPIF